jgi:bifunctional enzyme CysN/CysC
VCAHRHRQRRPADGGGRPVVTLTLADEIDISRGDVISAPSPAEVADQFECAVVWMDDEPMLPGRPYLMKIGTRT